MHGFRTGETVSNLAGNRFGVVDGFAARNGVASIVVAWFDGATKLVSPRNLLHA
jgi:hypothetical protein